MRSFWTSSTSTPAKAKHRDVTPVTAAMVMPRVALPQHPVIQVGKFVCALLVLAVLAMPAAALVSCWAPPLMSAGCPLCLAMAHNPGTAVQEAPGGTSCCDLSNGKPAPASVLQAPTTTTLVAPAVSAVVAVSVAAPARVDHPTDQRSASPPVSPQAVLCTFLI